MTRSSQGCAPWRPRRTLPRTTGAGAVASTRAPRGIPGYAVSQLKRKRIEEIFGWLKTVALLRKLRHRGRALVEWIFTFALSAYNLVRIRNLTASTA